MTAHVWSESELQHAWLHSGYTTVDTMLEIGTM